MADDQSATTINTGSTTPMSRGEIMAMFDRRMRAYNNLDAATLASDYADRAIVESPLAGTHEGRAAIERVFKAWFDSFSDMKVTSDGLLIDGSRVGHVLRVEGTDVGGFLGLPPSGKHFHMPMVFLYDLQNRLIVRERRVYDFTGLLVQIGVLKARPA